jgi:acyl-CoA synthetase (AMP-forming)/AMP-acid ligase II
LLAGAQALAARLDPLVEGGLAAWRAIVSSVPPQHMFGFETSVLLPLLTGIPVVERRPLLPLDVHAALALAGGPAAWIATPLHLRALAQAGQELPDCRLALVSTMPLSPALAAQVEPLLRAPVIEIFGSTETGVLATRRTAVEPRWLPVGDVRLEQDDTATLACGAHFPSPRSLADVIDLAADGSFELRGRHADMVKIGGRRASLSGLNLLLQDLPGLTDGAFYLPPSDGPAQRLVLVHAGKLDRPAAERWLRERLDAMFLPRAWVQVERLPRDASGKLPRAALQAVYAAHRAAVAGENSSMDCVFSVAAEHPALPGHFPGRPIVPGVLVLDHVMARLRACTGQEVTGLPRVKFTAPLLPGESAQVCFRQRAGSVGFRVSAERGGGMQLIAEGSLVLGVAGTGPAA